ncbi:helix-turn-helix transcriptional regulator [Alteraurantiacibacter aestuarii]
MALAVIGLQAVAAIYFIFDAVGESRWSRDGKFGPLFALDLLVGFALLAGIAYAALTFTRLQSEARRRDRALSAARGALGQLIQDRFADWGLSRSEAEVALFALKGFSSAEIAEMRGAAGGTVRSQLSQVYAKAEVTGQPMLMSLFLDDLLGESGFDNQP